MLDRFWVGGRASAGTARLSTTVSIRSFIYRAGPAHLGQQGVLTRLGGFTLYACSG